MTAAAAYVRLRQLGLPVVTTAEAALRLDVSAGAASKLLTRLARDGMVMQIRRGLWGLDERVEPLSLPPFLTAPYPSYVSLQTALYLHGMISQMPSLVYVASLGKAQRIETALGTFSIHRLAPELFGGFETTKSGIALATPEKALLDLFYLSGTISRRFVALPELELPRRFRLTLARAWIARIRSRRLRTIVERRLHAALESARG